MENLSMKTGCGQVEQTIVEAVNLWVRLEPEKIHKNNVILKKT